MSATYDILIRPRPGVTDDDFLRDAAAAAGVEFGGRDAPDPADPEYVEYSAETDLGLLLLTVGETLGDDPRWPIGDYRYLIGMDTPGMTIPAQNPVSAEILHFMRKIYDGLVATDRYVCMLVWNLSMLLATNLPWPENVPPPPELPSS